jgi:hypothetical protein
MVASAVAFGPTVANVPDVWITDQGDTDNVFRYSDALVLLDYIIPGVAGGDGSTSDSLYWTYALKDASLVGDEIVGVGAFLNPAGQHYQINSFGAETPVQTEGTEAWKTEINSLATETLADAGALDFYNIRLNLDAITPVPATDPIPGLPDYQEATLYVTDGATTPSADTIIIATVEDDIPDQLSAAGTPCQQLQDYENAIQSTLNPWTEFAILIGWTPSTATDPIGVQRIQQADVTFAPTDVVYDTNSVAVTTPINQVINRSGRLPGLLVMVAPTTIGLTQRVSSVTGNKTTAYRLKATMDSDNVSSSTNTLVLLTLNGRNSIGASFGGFRQAGPAASTTVCATTYLVPTGSGSVLPALMIYDDSAVEGGTITISDVRIDSFGLGTMLYGEERISSGVGAANLTVGAANAPGVWTSLAINDASGVTMAAVPTVGSGTQSVPMLRVTATSAAAIPAPNGQALFGFDGQITTSADSLLVVKALINTSTADAAQIPTLRLTTLQLVGGPTDYSTFVINDFMLDRTLGYNGDSDVSTTLSDYYVIGETAGASLLNTLWFTGLANQANAVWAGDLQLHELTISEFPIPLCPCD